MKKRPIILGAILAVLIVVLIVFYPKGGDKGNPISEIPAKSLDLSEITPPNDVQYQICCWNLEHFSPTAIRGFPENSGIPARESEQLQALADKIKNDIQAEVYLFSEIEDENYFKEFIDLLGSDWDHVCGIGDSNMVTAFAWNTKAVKVLNKGNLDIDDPTYRESNKDKQIFDREPQFLHIALLDASGQEQNDVLLIGLHLLSGAPKNRERQDGMEILLNRMPQFLQDNGFDTSEKDIVFLGDLNDDTFLKFYDTRDDNLQLEYLFPYMVITCGYKALCSENYPGTRISGRKIDHIIISSDFDSECLEDEAIVQVPEMDFGEYRIKYTDHFPVFINVKLHPDND